MGQAADTDLVSAALGDREETLVGRAILMGRVTLAGRETPADLVRHRVGGTVTAHHTTDTSRMPPRRYVGAEVTEDIPPVPHSCRGWCYSRMTQAQPNHIGRGAGIAIKDQGKKGSRREKTLVINRPLSWGTSQRSRTHTTGSTGDHGQCLEITTSMLGMGMSPADEPVDIPLFGWDTV